ncbi:hypothetical protein ACWGQ5_20435 [Streptomyces sp. NPDC055722]
MGCAAAGASRFLTGLETCFATHAGIPSTSLRSTLAVYQRRKVPGATELARRAREALA